MNHLLFKILDPIAGFRNRMLPDYRADGVAVSGKNLGFLDDPAFRQAWDFAKHGNTETWKGKVPDTRWRAHFACWAADLVRTKPGDFVECGVFTGLLSMTVMRYLEIKRPSAWDNRKFYLFDTFGGIPDQDLLLPGEKIAAASLNRETYFDCYRIAQRNFSSFPSAKLIRGVLPASLDTTADALQQISYLSIDLNSAAPERAVIDRLWPLVVPGGVILLDDYAFRGHEKQYETWNDFAAKHDLTIATLPTGQGLIIKP